jgi:16S rRNA (cytosine1402-N4)-methyltransferase
MTIHHEPVMTREVLAFLQPERGGVFLDCTVGLGGHTRAMLEAGATRVIGLDRDPEALALAAEALVGFGDRVELVHSDYRAFESVLDARGIRAIDGALADLGMSSYQLEAEGRGFSFQREDPLDMRMDPTTGPTAADLLSGASESEIADAIYQFGEERFSRRVARAIVQNRETAAIRTTGQLAAIVRQAIPRRGFSRIDPATRTFQALRIWVNRELEGLDDFLAALGQRLKAGARMVVVTFHSLEDRLAKHTLRAMAQREGGTLRILTKKPVVPQIDEIDRNPRARSAKLRAAERLAQQ